MAVTIPYRITNPVIPVGSSAKFRVSYRLVGDTDWTFFAEETNAPFTLSVPTAGDYEILVEYQDCDPAILGPLHVLQGCACPEITASQLVRKTGGQVVIRLTFDTPLPSISCGYIFTYQRSGMAPVEIIPPNPLPNPFEVAVDAQFDYSWSFKVNCCGGKITPCGAGQLLYSGIIDDCISGEIKYDPSNPAPHIPYVVGGRYYFDVIFKQSTPATVPVQIVWNQIGAGMPGKPKDIAFAMVTPVPSGDPTYPWKATVEVHPSSFYPNAYSLWINDDICGRDVFWY